MNPAQPTTTVRPLLFIHGAWHGAWCWYPWVDYFKEAGYTATTVELRGHGYKEGSFKKASLEDYVNDVKMIIDTFDTPPILIGHSLGCSIIQHLMSVDEYPAAVLLAPIPKSSVFKRVFAAQIIKHPLLTLRSAVGANMYPWVTYKNSYKLFFSKEMNFELAQQYVERMQGESFHLFAVDLLRKLPAKQSKTPTLVVGAEQDSFFSVGAQKVTAKSIDADFASLPGSGHDIMLDVKKYDAAFSIHRWLNYNVRDE